MDDVGKKREVLESQRRLEGIVESAMDAIITINEDQRIILFNPAAEQMFGVSRDEALGQPIARFIPQRFRDGHDEHIRRFRKTGVTGRRMGALGAISGLRADGTEFPVEASISQVDLHDERLATVILRDITERIANEEARQLLAREVDHRAKNALAVVQALVSLTSAPTKDDFVTAVRGRVAALGRAHSLLAQNRWTGGDLAKIVTDETAAYCRPGQVRLDGAAVSLAPNAVQPLSLLIHELATNAVKYGAFSAASGRIDVVWRVAEDGHLEFTWSETLSTPTVAEPTSQGFGSTLIETVTRQLAGDIQTRWRPQGVQISVRLPPQGYRVEAEMPRVAKRTAGAGPNSKTLLIVEDELLVAMELANALRTDGWQIMGPAASVEEAFALLADGPMPDAAVLDINLNGQTVYPVADLLHTRGVPYLFCTGYETATGDDRYREKPIVRKPAHPAVLIGELRLLLGSFPDPDDREAA
jgi:PAS domain S-box-containing protein